ncbi:MAG: hypothetical protein J6386_12780 [Candidatus Synoicihabitans palmerolidicus]|nr:hypothetical protein [Candidatus Synoicihabitans palmerolidicus]
MGKTRVFEGVVDLADFDGEGGGGFIEIWVGDEDDFEAVIEDEVAEFGLVGGRDVAGWEGGLKGGLGGYEGGGAQGEGRAEDRGGETAWENA